MLGVVAFIGKTCHKKKRKGRVNQSGGIVAVFTI